MVRSGLSSLVPQISIDLIVSDRKTISSSFPSIARPQPTYRTTFELAQERHGEKRMRAPRSISDVQSSAPKK